MLPFKDKAHESGMTLVETMVASAIALVFTYGGYQMLGRTQKYLLAKQKNVVGKTEGIDLAAVLKKDWGYRLISEPLKNPAGVDVRGFKVLRGTAACTANCPTLKLWIRRTPVTGPSFMDEVTVENICITPDPTTAAADKTVPKLVQTLDFTADTIVNRTCGTCPKGQVPAVRFTGINMTTGKPSLGAENRIFPNNIANNQRVNSDDRLPMKQNNVLGMQACFSQSATGPLNVDIRSIVLGDATDKDGKPTQLMSIQMTQVFPYDNFANIRLE